MKQVKFDQFGGKEWISKESQRLAPFKSMYHAVSKGKKIVKEGYMQKEGKMFRTWRRRYFVLFQTGQMNYYQEKDLSEGNPISSFNVMSMKGTKRVLVGRQKQPGFHLTTTDRTWKFICDSEQEVLDWIRCINLLNDGVYQEE